MYPGSEKRRMGPHMSTCRNSVDRKRSTVAKKEGKVIVYVARPVEPLPTFRMAMSRLQGLLLARQCAENESSNPGL